MGPNRRIDHPNWAPPATHPSFHVHIDRHPRPQLEHDLEADLDQAAPGHGPQLTSLADRLHREAGGSRRGMLSAVLQAALLGLR